MEPLQLALIAWITGYLSVSLGMGYGTIMVPLLVFLGHGLLDSVAAILLTQFAGSLAAVAFHRWAGNASFSRGTLELRTGLIMGLAGALASIAAVRIALGVDERILQIYVGAVVAATGLFTLLARGRSLDGGEPSTRSLLLVAAVASLNKGLTGTGYGPIVTGGQMALGIDPRRAVATTSFAEILVCGVAGLYYASSGVFDPALVLPLFAGSLLAAPLAAATVRRGGSRLKPVVGTTILILGLALLYTTI